MCEGSTGESVKPLKVGLIVNCEYVDLCLSRVLSDLGDLLYFPGFQENRSPREVLGLF